MQNQITVNEVTTETFNVPINVSARQAWKLTHRANRLQEQENQYNQAMSNPEAVARWENGKSMLDAIHAEIEPKLLALKQARWEVYRTQDDRYEMTPEPTKEEIMALDKEIADSKL
jgi:hypothetical protein